MAFGVKVLGFLAIYNPDFVSLHKSCVDNQMLGG